MNREQMVEKARTLLRGLNGGMCHLFDNQPCKHCDAAADAMLDALLPQVTTVEELGKTPGVDLLVSPDGICAPASSWWSMVPMRDAVIPFPLTVVWQP